MRIESLASLRPPSYSESAANKSLINEPPPSASNGLRPRVAVLLGVGAGWHIPLLVCRGLSTVPAVWWGLRCGFTFLGELLLSESASMHDGVGWSVEKRFRVTEVFLAILWVRASPALEQWLSTDMKTRRVDKCR